MGAFEDYFSNYSASGGIRDVAPYQRALDEGTQQGVIGQYAMPPVEQPPSIADVTGIPDAVPKADPKSPKNDSGIGLLGTLGILNLGFGLGGQIYKMATAPKPRRPRISVPGGGGNMLR